MRAYYFPVDEETSMMIEKSNQACIWAETNAGRVSRALEKTRRNPEWYVNSNDSRKIVVEHGLFSSLGDSLPYQSSTKAAAEG